MRYNKYYGGIEEGEGILHSDIRLMSMTAIHKNQIMLTAHTHIFVILSTCTMFH